MCPFGGSVEANINQPVFISLVVPDEQEPPGPAHFLFLALVRVGAASPLHEWLLSAEPALRFQAARHLDSPLSGLVLLGFHHQDRCP